MFGLSKKKGAGAPGPPRPRIPTDRVVSLSSQGLSEPEIIKSLREQGFSPLEVDRAMKDALRTGAGVQAAPPPPGPIGPPTAEPAAPPFAGPATRFPTPAPPPAAPPLPVPEPPGAPEPMLPQAPAPEPGQPFGQPAASPLGRDQFAPTIWGNEDEDDLDDDDMMKLPQERRIGPGHIMSEMDDDLPPLPGPAMERKPLPFADEPLSKDRGERTRELKDRRRKEVEELTEEITDEKWSEIIKRVQGIEEKLDGMEASVNSAATAAPGTGAPSAELEDVKQDIEKQKRGIEDANARIDSLEEVVKGSLTPMVESIRKFSHAVKNAKGEEAPVVPPEAAPQPVAAPPEVVAPTTVPEATSEPEPAKKTE